MRVRRDLGSKKPSISGHRRQIFPKKEGINIRAYGMMPAMRDKGSIGGGFREDAVAAGAEAGWRLHGEREDGGWLMEMEHPASFAKRTHPDQTLPNRVLYYDARTAPMAFSAHDEHFCGKSAQVPFHELLTLKRVFSQSNPIKANQG